MTHPLTDQERALAAILPMTGQPVHINRDPNSPGSLERNVRRIERLGIAIAQAEAKGEGHLMGDHRRELIQRQARAQRAAEPRRE